MKHESAENLFQCLASYVQRPDRNPTEDFCTEILAWCLRNSNDFGREFLSSIQFLSSICLNIKNDDVISCVDTQRFFYLSEQDKKGRLDMAVESKDGGWVILFENKVDADFGHDQLPKYRQELLASDRYEQFAGKFLVTLTKTEIPPQEVDGHISWAKVHDALVKNRPISSDENSSAEAAAIRIICRQFAQYLKQKRLVPMQIPKIKTTGEFKDGILFREAAERLLLDFYDENNEAEKLMRRKVEFREDTNYLAFPPREKSYFSAGIAFFSPIELCVEGFWLVKNPPGDTDVNVHLQGRLPKSVFCSWNKGNKGFSISRSIEGELDGSRDEIIKWLNQATEFALGLRDGKLT